MLISCARHLTALEKEVLTPEQRAVRLQTLEAEEHACLDRLEGELDAIIERRKARA